VRIVPLGEKRNAVAFRPTRPLHERLAALQEIRLEDHCWKGDAASGLRKAHRTVKQA
jgi:L-rhamnose isomerase